MLQEDNRNQYSRSGKDFPVQEQRWKKYTNRKIQPNTQLFTKIKIKETNKNSK